MACAKKKKKSLSAITSLPSPLIHLPHHSLNPSLITPYTKGLRKKSVRQKLSAIGSEFANRNVLLLDDSIVRGTTSSQIVQMARDAGAKRVYMASAAPPVIYPNVYGIDMPTKQELIAARQNPKHNNKFPTLKNKNPCCPSVTCHTCPTIRRSHSDAVFVSFCSHFASLVSPIWAIRSNCDNEAIAKEIGADKMIYQDLVDLRAAILEEAVSQAPDPLLLPPTTPTNHPYQPPPLTPSPTPPSTSPSTPLRKALPYPPPETPSVNHLPKPPP